MSIPNWSFEEGSKATRSVATLAAIPSSSAPQRPASNSDE